MSLYAFATDPGARIEPDAGEKVSGFVPSTPAASKKLNDVLYELSTFAVAYETKFNVQHNSDGTHANITATDLIVTGGDMQVSASGAITALSLALSGNANVTGTVFGNILDATTQVQSPVYAYKSPYLEMTFLDGINQLLTLGTGNVSSVLVNANDAAVTNPDVQYPNSFKIYLDIGDDCIIPFQVGAVKDLDTYTVNFVAANDYDIDWELLRFNILNNGWETIESGNIVNGSISASGQLVTRTISFTDSSPDFPGHGFHIGVNSIMGMKFTANGNKAHIITVGRRLWATTVENAVK